MRLQNNQKHHGRELFKTFRNVIYSRVIFILVEQHSYVHIPKAYQRYHLK